MIEQMQSIALQVVVIAFVGFLLFVLLMIVRYSIISPILTYGSRKRLRKPNLKGIERLVGFKPSNALVDFYSNWPHLEQQEYYLVDTERSMNWFIGYFMPLSWIDAREWINASGKHGIPIATDLDGKGTYFVKSDGSIELRSPNIDGGRVKVAQSIEEFARFKVTEREEVDGDEDA